VNSSIIAIQLRRSYGLYAEASPKGLCQRPVEDLQGRSGISPHPRPLGFPADLDKVVMSKVSCVMRDEDVVEILEAYDLLGSYRAATEAVGCDHHTVRRRRLLPAGRRRL